MVELIVVMVLIGIIGTVAVGRFMERSTFDTVAWTEQVRSTLRYAQKVAIAQNHPVYVHMTQERLALCLDSDAACARLDARLLAPGGANSGSKQTGSACGSNSWMCEAHPDGVSMGLPGRPLVPIGGVVFNGLGRAAMLGAFGGKLEVKGDGITTVIGIDPESGYVD